MRTYIVEKIKKGRSTLVEGTVEEITNYFGYTLECGNSWNKKINRNPKTIKSLISNLEKAFDEVEGCCYERTSLRLITK